jgi:hypothetical protein
MVIMKGLIATHWAEKFKVQGSRFKVGSLRIGIFPSVPKLNLGTVMVAWMGLAAKKAIPG